MKVRSILFACCVALSTHSVAFAAGSGDHDHKHETSHGASEGPSHDAVHSGVSDDGSIHIHNAWTRATVKTAKVGGGFLSIVSTTETPDKLIAVESEASERVEIHTMTIVDDVARMRPVVGGLDIPAGGEIVLKPGAEHIMFLGLKEQFNEGDEVKVTLTFEKAGPVEVNFDINALGAKSHGGDHSDHSEHDHHEHSGHSKEHNH